MKGNNEIRPFINTMVHLTNTLHLAFADHVKALCDSLAATGDAQPLPPKLAGAVAEMSAAAEAESRSYRRSRTGDVVQLTQQLKAADQQRDRLLGALRMLCRAMTNMPYAPERQQAAASVLDEMHRTKVSANDDYTAEWAKLQLLVRRMRQDATLSRAAATLGLGQLLDQLEQANDLAERLVTERNTLRATYDPNELRRARLRTDDAYRSLCLLVAALARIEADDDGASRYDPFVGQLNATIHYYKTTVLRNRKQGRKSDDKQQTKQQE